MSTNIAAAAAAPAAAASAAPAARRYACDVHTHTLYSRHAYSTVEENVRAAAEAGLELLGITEHFSDMLFGGRRELCDFQYFLNLNAWPRLWHGVRLLHGCEADIVDLDGRLFGWDTTIENRISGDSTGTKITLKDFAFRQCDYVIASIHGKEWTKGASIATTTQMYIRALEDPKVAIVGHPGRAGVPFDIDELLAAARDLHKMVELNEHSFAFPRPKAHKLCRQIAERCAETGTMVAVSSDAHISYDVGRFAQVPAMLDEIHFPPELIATRSAEAFSAALAAAGLPLQDVPMP
jgi:putative hydrolase